MKILITTFTYFPHKDGVSEACRVMVEGLTLLGWQVWVATSMGYEYYIEEGPTHPNKVNVSHFRIGRHPLNSRNERAEVERFHKFIADENFDVIVNHCWDTHLACYLQLIQKTLNARFVMVSHGYARHLVDWQRNPLKGWGVWLRGMYFTLRIFPKMLRGYHKVIFLSHKKNWSRFFDHWVASATCHPGIHIIANGIDLAQLPATDEGFRETHAVGDSPMALCVANYSERKNQLLALRAFREANVPDSVLVFIGSEFNDYAQKARALDEKLSGQYPKCRVLFLEKLTRKETFAAYVACDFFLLAAKAETQPIVLIEAMAAGKPWISTNTGCVSEMAGGVVCSSQRQIPHAIRDLFQNKTKRHRLGMLGMAEAHALHDATQTASTFDAVLRETLAYQVTLK